MPLYKDCQECQFFHYCGKNVPEYSIFDILRAPQVNEIYADRGTAEIKADILPNCNDKAIIDVQCFLEQAEYVDKPQIIAFLDSLE